MYNNVDADHKRWLLQRCLLNRENMAPSMSNVIVLRIERTVHVLTNDVQ